MGESNLSAFDQHIFYLEAQLKEAKIKASQSLQIVEDCDKAQESLLDPSSCMSTPVCSPAHRKLLPPPAADNLTLSSNIAPPDSATILNNNLGEVSAVTTTTTTNATTNNIFENETNNNNNVNTHTMDIRHDNENCLKAFMTEEDSANGNMTLPV